MGKSWKDEQSWKRAEQNWGERVKSRADSCGDSLTLRRFLEK